MRTAESRPVATRAADATARRAVPVFAALGDRTRLALVGRLRDGGAHSIARLTEGLGLTRQAIAKHLRVLEDAGLVASARAGRESRYALRREGLADAREWLDRAAAQWDEAIARLQAHLGETAPPRARRPRARRAR